MRYHTTLKDIAISVLVLLSCAILTLYGMVYLDMRNPSRYLSDYLISSLNQTGPYTFTSTGLKRTFLKDLTVLNLSLQKDDTVLASAKEGIIKGGIPLLVQSVLQGNQRISLQLEQVRVQLDNSLTIAQNTEGAPTFVSRWVKGNTLLVHSDSVEGTFHSPSIQADVRQAAFNFELKNGNTLPTLQAKAGGVHLQIGAGDISLKEINLNLNEEGAVSFTSSYHSKPVI